MAVATTEGLSPAQLKWLRDARSVSFHFTPGVGAEIRARDGDEARLDISVAGNVHGYDHHASSRAMPLCRAYASILSAQFSETWKSIASVLRTGDRLMLDFRADHFANGYTKAVTGGQTYDGTSFGDIHVDALFLRIERGEAPKVKRLKFLVDVTACPNNSARMIQGA